MMEFGSMISELPREHIPRAFKQIARAGQLQTWAQARSREGHDRVEEILAQAPDTKTQDGRENLNARRGAEEMVLADLTDFQTKL